MYHVYVVGEREMRAFKVIKDPKAFQLIGDETRRRVIYLLRAKDLTVSQIAADLDRTPQAIYHHIGKLKEAGMIEVAKEERVDHFIETYYRATAEVFQFSHGEGALSKEFAQKEVREALLSLPQLGFTPAWDEATVGRLVELEMRMDELGSAPELEDRIMGLETVGFLAKQIIGKLARFATMTDGECEEYVRQLLEFRSLLKSTLAPKATE